MKGRMGEGENGRKGEGENRRTGERDEEKGDGRNILQVSKHIINTVCDSL
jgi:hypothetical protein